MKKVFLYSALLTTVFAVGGASIVSAEDGKDKTVYSEKEGKSIAATDGKVKFVGSDGKTDIPDPEDPAVVVDPEDPVNPGNDPLRITYVSPFNFNQRAFSATTAKVAAAESVQVKSVFKNSSSKTQEELDAMKEMFGDLNGTEIRDTVPFVSTLDSRTDRQGGWNLAVQHSPFVLAKDGKTELKGASINFINSRYVKGKQDEASLPTLTPTAAKELKVEKLVTDGTGDKKQYDTFLNELSSGFTVGTDQGAVVSQAVSTGDAKTDVQGVGAYSLALGNNLEKDKNELSKQMIKDGEKAAEFKATNGVILKVPAKTATELSMKNEAETKTETDKDLFYHTTITWTLSPGVAAK